MTSAPSDVSGDNPEGVAYPHLGRSVANRYLIEGVLGDGASGVVYAARHTTLDRLVALKVLRPEYSLNERITARFAREAKAASRLDHPNIVRVFDYGVEPDGLLFIAFEFVEGSDLATMIQQQAPLPATRIANILSQILAALTVAHEAGIVHRDIKPENILIQTRAAETGQSVDFVKVCDFGIALLREDSPLAGTGQVTHLTGNLIIGTPAYMSPEQARGEVLDARSDIYSLGLVGYQMLCAELPFEDASPFGLAFRQIHEEPVAPSLRAVDVDAELEKLCLRAMRKNPQERFQSAREMRRALRAAGFAELNADLTAAFPAVRVASNQSESEVASDRAAAPPINHRPNDTSTSLSTNRAGAQARHYLRHRSVWPVALVIVASGLLWGLLHRATSARVQTAALRTSSTVPSPQSSADIPPKPLVSVSLARPTAVNLPPADDKAVSLSHKRPVIAHSGTTAHASNTPESSVANLTLASRPSASAESVSPDFSALEHPAARPVRPSTPNNAPIESSPAGAQNGQKSVPASPRTGDATAHGPAPAFDPSSASVRVGQATNVQGATSTAFNRALGGIEAQLTACYRAALPTLTGTLSGPAILHIETDGAGRITTARLGGHLDPRLTSCAASAARARRVAHVDTGTARADVLLDFKAR